MVFRICAVTAVGILGALGGTGITEVPVGGEFVVEATVKPQTSQIGPNGVALMVEMPLAPYRWEFKYDRGLVQFLRSDDPEGATVYREIEGTPWAVLSVETSKPLVHFYWQALRTTETDVALPTLNALAADEAPLGVANSDKLRIVPLPATLEIRLQGVTDGG